MAIAPNMKALGQLPNAPLAYVLGAVNFDLQLELEKHIPHLQARLQAQFPRFQILNETVIQPGPAGPSVVPNPQAVRYEFASGDNRHGVIVNRQALIFHATAYTTYEDFGRRMSEVLTAVKIELPHLFVRRLGLRYVDIFVPAKGEQPDDYVNPGLRCLPSSSLPASSRSGFAVTEFALGQGALVVRYLAAPGRLGLPLDLQPFSLAPPAVIERDASEAMWGLLDFDRFLPQQAVFDSDELKQLFDELHRDLSTAFRELTTDHAQKVWRRKAK